MAIASTVDEGRADQALAARLRRMELGAFRVEAKRMLADPKLTKSESNVIFGEAEDRGATLAQELIRYAQTLGAHVAELSEALDHVASVSDTGG